MSASSFYRDLYRRLLRFSHVAARFSFIGAAIYAAYQWEAAKADAQVKETLIFYDRYNSPPFTQYRDDLAGLIAKNRDRLVEAKSETQYSSQIVEIMKSSDSANGLDLLSDLFDGISACVTSDLCDKHVAAKLFQPRANQIFNVFYPYIKYVREQNKSTTFAVGLENMRNQVPETPGIFKRLWNYIF